MAGYSGTPLARKLGIKTGSRVFVVGRPASYFKLLAPLPDSLTFVGKLTKSVDLVHIFATRRAELETLLTRYRPIIKPDAAIWASWPKKSAKVITDLTEKTVREIALPIGLVDVKVCAIDEVWSALKLVIPHALR